MILKPEGKDVTNKMSFEVVEFVSIRSKHVCLSMYEVVTNGNHSLKWIALPHSCVLNVTVNKAGVTMNE